MASKHANNGVRKCHNRLETFLQRALDFDTYQRIRAHESCIVCSEKENRAFKFLILCDNWIYLMDNDPGKLSIRNLRRSAADLQKTLSKVIHLQDIVSLSQESDYPDFLHGDERENSQHIIVGYLTDEKKKSKKNAKSELDEKQHNQKDTQHESSSGQKSSKSSRSLFRTLCAQSSLAKTDNINESARKSPSDWQAAPNALSVTARQGLNPQSQNTQPSCDKCTPAVTTGHITLSNNHWENDRTNRQSVKLYESLDASVLRDALVSQKDTKSITAGDSSQPKTGYDLNGLTAAASDQDLTHSHPDAPNLDLQSNFGSRRSSLNWNLNVEAADDADERSDLRTAVLHLYILTTSSHIFSLIRCAMNSCIIRRTLEMDPAFIFQQSIVPQTACSEKLEIRFSQLKSELFSQQNSLFDIFDCVQELRDGTERHFILKKFFWKSDDIFKFLVNQLLRLCLPVPTHLRHLSTDAELHTPVDQLELLLLIVETLTLMLHESEIFQCRVACLKTDDGAVVKQLITLLLERPMNVEHLANSEQNLVDEFVVRGLGLLYELLVVSQQCSWSDEAGSFFTVNWIVDVLEQLDRQHLESYLDSVVQHALILISTKNEPRTSLDELLQQPNLEAEEVILVFHQFFILDILTYYSDSILVLLQDKYFEEFKFYVRMPIVRKRLSRRYLLSSRTIKLIESVSDRICNVRVRLSQSQSMSAAVARARLV